MLIADPCLSPAQSHLRDLISEISEKCWFAGWMDGTEFEVWRLATAGGEWGRGSAAGLEAELREATALARDLGVWLVWSDRVDCDQEPIGLMEWRGRYDAWASRDIAQG